MRNVPGESSALGNGDAQARPREPKLPLRRRLLKRRRILPDKLDVERLLHCRLGVLANKAVVFSIVGQNVRCAGITHIVQFDDDLQTGAALHPNCARNFDWLRIEVSGFKRTAEVGVAQFKRITAVDADPAAQKFLHAVRNGGRCFGRGSGIVRCGRLAGGSRGRRRGLVFFASAQAEKHGKDDGANGRVQWVHWIACS